MKRTCEGCRALEDSTGRFHYWVCSLQYKIDENKAIPLENCPKPKTNIKLVELSQLKKKYDLTNEELAEWKF